MSKPQVVFSDVVASEDQFQLATYKKMPIVAERGAGVWLYSNDGEKYLDLYGGHAVAATGHCHPQVVEAIQRQAAELEKDATKKKAYLTRAISTYEQLSKKYGRDRRWRDRHNQRLGPHGRPVELRDCRSEAVARHQPRRERP